VHAAAVTVTQCENSDVLFEGSVAVAVIELPTGTGTGKLTEIAASQPAAGVVTLVKPMKTWPSPFPEPSHKLFEKNSILKVVFCVLFKFPVMLVVPPTAWAEVRSGKF
jgi:hypothetical protein